VNLWNPHWQPRRVAENEEYKTWGREPRERISPNAEKAYLFESEGTIGGRKADVEGAKGGGRFPGRSGWTASRRVVAKKTREHGQHISLGRVAQRILGKNGRRGRKRKFRFAGG